MHKKPLKTPILGREPRGRCVIALFQCDKMTNLTNAAAPEGVNRCSDPTRQRV